jgi:hypothetical protein
LELDGLGVTPDRFLRGARAFFGILDEVTQAVCNGRPNVQWRVQVKAASNLIGVVPVPGFHPEIVGTIETALRDGINALERGDVQPAYFTESAMRHARALGEVANTSETEDVRVRLWTKKIPAAISRHIALNVLGALAEEFEDHGSLDGRLQTVSERGAMRFIVYDTLTDRGIPCYVSEDKLRDALGNFQKRVEVYGQIRYRKDGSPVSIRVEEIVPFPPASEVPDFRSVYGILRGKT